MSEDIQAEIERLQAQVARRQAEASKLEAEIGAMERELVEFNSRYERLIAPARALLDAVQAAIEEIEHQRHAALYADARPLESWTQPGDYVPVEEQYERVWGKGAQTPLEQPSAEPRPRDSNLDGDPETRLKHLFRALARRYHPDFAVDAADRDYRTRLMAMINEAYAERDVATLQTLMDQPAGVSADVPLAVLRLRDLKQSLDALERRVSSLTADRTALLHSDVMRLKVEQKLAAAQGRDLLGEIADQLEQEYWNQVARLDELRRQDG